MSGSEPAEPHFERRDPAFETIEIKIAFLERANAELSDVVFRQQLELSALQRALEALAERVRMDAAQPVSEPADERPPHY